MLSVYCIIFIIIMYKLILIVIKFDYIINTTGPWSGHLLKSFGVGDFEVMPTLGYMASYDYLFSISDIR